jgi:hypothetical protein
MATMMRKTHGMRNEIIASEQKSKKYVPSACCGDEERENASRITDLVWQKAWSIRHMGAKMSRRTLSTEELRSRTSLVAGAQSAQATHNPRAWANTGESP